MCLCILNFHFLVLYFLLSIAGSEILDSFLENALTTDGLQSDLILSWTNCSM